MRGISLEEMQDVKEKLQEELVGTKQVKIKMNGVLDNNKEEGRDLTLARCMY